MANLDDVISLVENKISKVIHFAEGLLSENAYLKGQVEELSGLLLTKNDEVKVLESKNQSLKFTKTLSSLSSSSSPDDVKDVKLQLNRMIREIDKCIALLNR